jgi:hypothetical protein
MENIFEYFKNDVEEQHKKRFACAHCGKTWVEIVGLVAGNVEGQEDVYFRIGQDSDICRNCKFSVRSCPTCGSNDAYEISFPSNENPDSPLSFNRIRIVSRM